MVYTHTHTNVQWVNPVLYRYICTKHKRTHSLWHSLSHMDLRRLTHKYTHVHTPTHTRTHALLHGAGALREKDNWVGCLSPVWQWTVLENVTVLLFFISLNGPWMQTFENYIALQYTLYYYYFIGGWGQVLGKAEGSHPDYFFNPEEDKS